MPRRPVAGPVEVSGDTATHAEYGVGPATDYKAGSGTPIYAPFAGVVGRWWSDTGGNTVQVRGSGISFIGQHLSSYGAGGSVPQGALIGYSGNTGSMTTGPHLHCWIEAGGSRVSFEEWAVTVGLGFVSLGDSTPSGTAPAGGGSGTIESDDMSAAAEQQIAEMYQVLIADQAKGAQFTGVEPRLRAVQQAVADIKYVLTVDAAGGDQGVEPRLRAVQRTLLALADPKQFAAQLAPALAELIDGEDADTLGPKIAAALAPSFAAIPQAVRDELIAPDQP